MAFILVVLIISLFVLTVLVWLLFCVLVLFKQLQSTFWLVIYEENHIDLLDYLKFLCFCCDNFFFKKEHIPFCFLFLLKKINTF